MAIFRSLTFDGINSLDYGIYITGEAVYNAPERDVEMVTIPGKNGALALDQGRFENIEVTYHAGCFADSQTEFADKVMKFRNALASRYTYNRLTDEYHTDEYRLGLYKSGLEVDAVHYSTAGEFDITFDCKPQRFLTSGETALTPSDYIDTQTATGEIVTIDSDGSLGVKALKVALDPIQDLNGYDHPWVGGAGKNLLDPQYRTYTATSNVRYYRSGGDGLKLLKDVTYTLSVDESCTRPSGIYINEYGTSTHSPLAYKYNSYSVSFTPTEDVVIETDCYYYKAPTEGIENIKVQLEKGSTATAWTPYSNVCPISGRTEVVTHVSPTTSASDGNTYTTDLGRTVYGGTLDVVSGVLTVDRAMITLDGTQNISIANWRPTSSGVGWVYPYSLTNNKTERSDANMPKVISDSLPTITYATAFQGTSIGVTTLASTGSTSYGLVVRTSDASLTTASAINAYLSANPITVCYELATPQTYQLTPQQIGLLLGENNLWSDGEITVTYGVHPYYNPSPFDSKPLIKVTGRGTLGIGEYILTITGTESQTLYIDCETMEIYTLEGTVPTGASSLVSINRNDFPVLEPGTNNISVGSGITAVTITPRWWRI